MNVNYCGIIACDLLTTEYDDQLLEAIITLTTSGTCECASEMVYLQ